MKTTMNNVRLDNTITDGIMTLSFFRAPLEGDKLNKDLANRIACVEMKLADIPEDVKKEAMEYGFSVKMSRNLAMSKDAAKITTVSECIDSTNTLWDSLKAGSWTIKSKAKKVPAYTASAVEAGFLAGVKNGVLSYEQANAMYMSMSGGKALYKEPVETDTDDDNTDDDNA